MSDQILSQTEIDALLSAVNDGKIDVEQEADGPVQDTGAGAVK